MLNCFISLIIWYRVNRICSVQFLCSVLCFVPKHICTHLVRLKSTQKPTQYTKCSFALNTEHWTSTTSSTHRIQYLYTLEHKKSQWLNGLRENSREKKFIFNIFMYSHRRLHLHKIIEFNFRRNTCHPSLATHSFGSFLVFFFSIEQFFSALLLFASSVHFFSFISSFSMLIRSNT